MDELPEAGPQPLDILWGAAAEAADGGQSQPA
eukprot:SAG22_NODE_7174_length_767_cov_2.035928_1_plen_31_part_01